MTSYIYQMHRRLELQFEWIDSILNTEIKLNAMNTKRDYNNPNYSFYLSKMGEILFAKKNPNLRSLLAWIGVFPKIQ